MKKGQTVDIHVFGEKLKGIVLEVNKNKTLMVDVEGVKYPNVQTFKTLPTIKKEIPPWYILK